MDAVIEYILANYTWILFGSIIILLAIIGWYADKTNFGQGKKNIDTEEQAKSINDYKKELGNKKLLDEVNHNNITEDQKGLEDNIINQETMPDEQINNIEVSNQDIQMNHSVDNINNNTLSSNESISAQSNLVEVANDNQKNITMEELEKSDLVFADFEKEFNEIIPEKEIIDQGLLEDIENLTLDKTQKIDLSDIPDLDDVDLPRIKQMQANDDGIWKF